jgi:hypothetical protein
MSDETKPTTIPEPTPAVVEPTTAPVVPETAAEEKPVEATTEPTKAEETAAVEEPKVVEPIFSGTLKYVTGPTIK